MANKKQNIGHLSLEINHLIYPVVGIARRERHSITSQQIHDAESFDEIS